MIKYLGIILSICLLIGLNSCEKDYIKNDSENTSDSGNGNNEDDSNGTISESENDYVWDASTEIAITLNGTTIDANSDYVTVNGSVATIKKAGNFNISGTLNNGQIIVEDTVKDDPIHLILNNVQITCSNSAPIYIVKAKKVIIITADNTTNSLTDGSSYTLASTETDEPSATIYSKSNLSFYGNGQLNITANYNDAIAGKDGLIIKSGNINITSKDDGIIGKDYLVVHGGTISITSTGDGLKSTNTDDATVGYIIIDGGNMQITSTTDAIQTENYITINGGNINITSGGGSSKTVSSTTSAKGIKSVADLTINDGTVTISSADDALHTEANLAVNGGTIELSSGDDGMHAETSIELSNTTISITKSYEGIESGLITVNSGTISVVSSNDGFNASMGTVAGGTESNDGSNLNVNWGTILVNMTGQGDGFDSNGNITMTGGTLIIQGPSSQPELAYDYNGTFKITGGLLIASGPNSGNMVQAPSTSSTQYAALIINSSIGTNLFHIQDADGKELVTFKPIRSAYYIGFSSADIQNGSTYSVYTGGSYSGGTTTNGYSIGGTYSGGSQLTTFTVSSIITKVGSTTGGGGGGPGGW